VLKRSIGLLVETDELERKSRLLNILLYSLVAISGVVIITVIVLGTAQVVSTIIAVLAALPIFGLSYWLNRKGWFFPATYVFLGGVIIFANAFILMPDVAVETRGLCPFFYTIAVVTSSLLITPRASFWLATFGAVVLGIVVALGGGPSLFTSNGDQSLGWGVMLTPILFSYLFASLSWFYSSHIGEAFLALRQREEELRLLNEELKAAGEDAVRGLDGGDGEYRFQAEGNKQLVARVRAMLQRIDLPSSAEIRRGPAYSDDFLTVDITQRQVIVKGERVKLTPREFDLLTLLVGKAGHILTHKEILEKVWGWEYIDDLDYVRVYISHLRRKVESDPALPRYILNEPGVGYYFQKAD